MKRPELVSHNQEQCFPLYHDLYTKTKGITDNFKQGNLDIALQAAKELMETHPHYSRGFIWAATIEGKRGNDHAALEYLRRAKADNGQNPFVVEAIARYHDAHGNYTEAERLNTEAKKLDPRQHFAYDVQMDYLEVALRVSFAEADQDPCQPNPLPHAPPRIFAPMAYNEPNSIEIIGPSNGVWRMLINGKEYRICPDTQLAVTKPTSRTENIPAEDLHNHLTEPASLESFESNGVNIIKALIFYDP